MDDDDEDEDEDEEELPSDAVRSSPSLLCIFRPHSVPELKLFASRYSLPVTNSLRQRRQRRARSNLASRATPPRPLNPRLDHRPTSPPPLRNESVLPRARRRARRAGQKMRGVGWMERACLRRPRRLVRRGGREEGASSRLLSRRTTSSSVRPLSICTCIARRSWI